MIRGEQWRAIMTVNYCIDGNQGDCVIILTTHSSFVKNLAHITMEKFSGITAPLT